jgi:hypothetical protein
MLPERAFQKRLGGYAPATLEGGGGGGIMAVVAVVATVIAAVATDGASLAAEAAVDGGAIAADGAVAAGETAAAVTEAASTAAITEGTAAAAGTAAADTAVATGADVAASNAAAAADFVGPTGVADVGAADTAASQAAMEGILKSAGQGALKNVAMTGLNNVISGKPITPGQLINSGVMGAVSGGTGNFLGQEGLSPLASGAISGAATGATGAALNGGNIGRGALVGGAGGAASGAAGQLGQSVGLNPIAQGALTGAASGATNAAINNRSIGTGALSGGIVGGATSAGNQIGDTIQNNATDSSGNKTLLGQVLGGAANYEAKTVLAGSPTQTGGALRTTSTGLPTAAVQSNNQATIQNQAGIPTLANQTSNGISSLELAGSQAGIPTGSSVNFNTGTASNMAPSSGLNNQGLPASLTPGVLTSSNAPSLSNSNYQLENLLQLHPQLNSVDPRILASLTASTPIGYKRGGAVHFANGGHAEHIPEFITGKTGHHVKGRGTGQSDEIPAMLANDEYVFDADTVAALGDGSSEAGAKFLDHFRQSVRAHKRAAPVDKIPPKASPLQYVKEAMKKTRTA